MFSKLISTTRMQRFFHEDTPSAQGEQIWPSTCLYKVSRNPVSSPCLLTACATAGSARRRPRTAASPYTLPHLPFTENVCQPLLYTTFQSMCINILKVETRFPWNQRNSTRRKKGNFPKDRRCPSWVARTYISAERQPCTHCNSLTHKESIRTKGNFHHRNSR